MSVLLHIIMFVSFNLSQGGIVAPDCELIVLSTEGILNAQEVLFPLIRILIHTTSLISLIITEISNCVTNGT